MNLRRGSESSAERHVNDRVAAEVIERLVAGGLLPAGPAFDPRSFRRLQERVTRRFLVEQSSITTLMARVLHGIAGCLRPRRVLCLGSYLGNALVWLAGPVARAAEVLGLDTDPRAVARARRNFDRIGLTAVRLECGDGHRALERIDAPLDLVLLDAEDASGKRLYRSLLERLEPGVAAGGVVLAHDACHPRFQEDLTAYFHAVRDPGRFRASLSLAIDPFGLEVTRK
jgi:predicted O-methyltransferase YrrM